MKFLVWPFTFVVFTLLVCSTQLHAMAGNHSIHKSASKILKSGSKKNTLLPKKYKTNNSTRELNHSKTAAEYVRIEKWKNRHF